MTKVVNKYKNDFDAYIGRGSIFIKREIGENSIIANYVEKNLVLKGVPSNQI